MKMHHSTQSNSNFVASRPADSAAMERWKVAVVTDEAADTWADGPAGETAGVRTRGLLHTLGTLV